MDTQEKQELKQEDQKSSESGAKTEVEKEESGASADQKKEEAVDWKAIAEKERAEKENYKNALLQKRQLRKADHTIEIEDEPEEDKLTAAVSKVVQEQVLPVLTQNKVDTMLSGLVKDPAKREVVKLYYENRIRQTGNSDQDIQRDLQTALDLADAQELRKVVPELKRAAMTEKPTPLSGSSADRGQDKKNHQFSDEQVKALEARATALGLDPKKYVEQAWKNMGSR